MNEKKNLTIEETFALAVQNHRKNNLQVAEKLYKKVLNINSNDLQSNFLLGTLSAQTKQFDIAKKLLNRSIEINPNYAQAHYNLGNVLKELGEYQKAISFYQMAVKYEPENLAHLYNLSRFDEKILHSNLKNKIYKIIEKNNSTKKNIAYGNFLLSRYELKAKKYKNEFDHLLKGHQYYFESEKKKFEKGVEYFLNVLSKKKELINLNRHNKNIKIDNYAIKPIFIIGVPRSGSTLIEKVIASGSQYIPIGEETGIIHTVVQNLINHKQSLNSDIDQFQTKIVETYKQKGLVQEESNYMFTDKSLENFFYISIIKKIFPQAKVINCRRNALSSIMSTLKNNLLTLSWAHNLKHIFKYYDIYYQMIKNFETTHSNFIYDLQYEKFVSDPENEAKKLMKFCSLPWDIKCLEFYKRRDLISKTASNIQFRKAVYKDSINKYLPYKQFLSKYGNKYSWFN
jgi:tetratricopeptide (TPR) repeat protein